jgi:hypothetical protein
VKHDLENLRRDTIALLTKIEREDAEARAQERVRAAVAEALVEHERNRPAPVPKRSEMSTAAKAKYISEHGSAQYLALPWK